MTACNGSESFALQVLGPSMAPEFPAGCIVIVEPAGVVTDGCFVVAEHLGEVLLRQLKMLNGHWFLHALADNYPALAINGLEQIRGLVIQRAGRRRRDSKLYV